MRAVLAGLVAVALLAASGACAADGNRDRHKYAFPVESGVHTLTDDTFDAFIDAHPTVVVEFSMPWCDYCRTLQPEYEQAPKLANATMDDGAPFPAVFANVDCEYSPELYARFDVAVFPTFKLFRNGLPEPLGDGQTPKTGEAVVAATRKSLGLSPTSYAHAVAGLSQAGEWLFYRGWSDLSMQSTVMGFFPGAYADAAATAAAADARAAFEAAAALLAGTIRFGVTADTDVMSAFSLPTDAHAIVLYKSYDEGKERYDGPPSAAALQAWAMERNHPLAVALDRASLRKWQNQVDTLVHLFVDERGTQEPRSRLAFLSALRAVGRSLEADGVTARGDVLYTVVDGVKQAAWLRDFGLEGVDLPAVALLDTVKHRMYGLPRQVGDLGTVGEADPKDATKGDPPLVDEAAVREFVAAFYAGTLTPASEVPM